MTTQDHQTEVTGSYDESQTAAAGTPLDSEQSAAAVSSDPPTAAAEPSPVNQEQSQSTDAPADAPTAPNGEAAVSGQAASAEHSGVERESSTEELFADDDLEELRGRWTAVQAGFVDDPKDCVQKADVLVSDLVEQLTTGFAHARSRLEEQWARGEEASTEDLRVALMHYREFFERLLAV
jgi:hypothetical protein